MKIWIASCLLFGVVLHGDSFPSLTLKNNYKKFDEWNEGKKAKNSTYSPSLIGLKAEVAEEKGVSFSPLMSQIEKSPLMVKEAFIVRKINQDLKKGQVDSALKSLETIKSSALLANDNIVANLFLTLPSAQKKALIDIVQSNNFLDIKTSPCPYFELPARQDRATLLKNILSQPGLLDESKQKIWRELYIDKPEVFSEKELLETGQTLEKETFTFEDHLVRAENLLLFGKNDDAWNTVSSFLSDKTLLNEEQQCKAEYTLAKIMRKKKKFGDALERLKSLIGRCDGDILLKSKFLFLNISTIVKDKETLPLFDEFVSRYKEHTFSDDVLFFKAKLLYEIDQKEEAIKVLKQITDLYPSGDMYFKALFLRGFYYAESNRPDEAIAVFEKMATAAPRNSEEFFQATYWKNRLKIAPNLLIFNKTTLKKAEAKDLTDLALAKNASVYSWFAFDILKECGQKITRPKPRSLSSKLNAATDKKLIDIEQLIRFGFRREALAMLLEMSPEGLNSNDQAMLARYFDTLNRTELAHRKVIQCHQGAKFALMEKDPALYQSVAFPRIYEQQVKEAIKNTTVAPEYLFAIMKNESGFLSDALSWAQARGLMQIMMPTANDAARRLKIPKLSENDLFNPKLNIKLGANIFDTYIKRYGLLLGIAAYNAGPTPVKKWQKPQDVPADTVMELISFPETLNYSKKILSAIWAYYENSSGAPASLLLQKKPVVEVSLKR